jgi:hypothetical protein
VKGKVVMQWLLFHQAPSKSHAEEERIDMLARRFMFTGLMLGVTVASGAWISTLFGS